MKNTTQSLVIGNWKMNPQKATEAKKIATELKSLLKKNTSVMVVVAPPALYLGEVKKALGTSTIVLGAQTVNAAPLGAQTGELSVPMLTDAGVGTIIVGHSERRALGETDAMIADKVTAILKGKLTPIICIGERERDTQGNFLGLVETQIKTALSTVPKARFKDIVIAYEPIWAIGTGATATPDDVNEMRLFIQKTLTKHFDRAAAMKVRIIYGGSVSAENAASLYVGSGVDGFLVGGASLRPAEFAKIVSSVS